MVGEIRWILTCFYSLKHYQLQLECLGTHIILHSVLLFNNGHIGTQLSGNFLPIGFRQVFCMHQCKRQRSSPNPTANTLHLLPVLGFESNIEMTLWLLALNHSCIAHSSYFHIWNSGKSCLCSSTRMYFQLLQLLPFIQSIHIHLTLIEVSGTSLGRYTWFPRPLLAVSAHPF